MTWNSAVRRASRGGWFFADPDQGRPVAEEHFPSGWRIAPPTAGSGSITGSSGPVPRLRASSSRSAILKVRYKQTVLGIAWTMIQPLVAAVIFTIVFGRLAGLESDGLPYAVYVFSGLVLWSYFFTIARVRRSEPRSEPRPRDEDVLPGARRPGRIRPARASSTC